MSGCSRSDMTSLRAVPGATSTTDPRRVATLLSRVWQISNFHTGKVLNELGGMQRRSAVRPWYFLVFTKPSSSVKWQAVLQLQMSSSVKWQAVLQLKMYKTALFAYSRESWCDIFASNFFATSGHYCNSKRDKGDQDDLLPNRRMSRVSPLTVFHPKAFFDFYATPPPPVGIGLILVTSGGDFKTCRCSNVQPTFFLKAQTWIGLFDLQRKCF